LKVYLGGGKGTWREDFKKALPTLETYDPFTQSNQSALCTFTIEDLKAIDSCDIVVFHIDYPEVEGSMLEAGYSFAKGKKIYTVWLLKGRLPSMFIGVSYRVFTSLESCLEYLKTHLEIKE